MPSCTHWGETKEVSEFGAQLEHHQPPGGKAKPSSVTLILAILVAAAKCPLKWPLLWNWLHMVSLARTFPCQRPPVGTHPPTPHSTDLSRSARAAAPNGKELDKGEEGHPCSVVGYHIDTRRAPLQYCGSPHNTRRAPLHYCGSPHRHKKGTPAVGHHTDTRRAPLYYCGSPHKHSKSQFPTAAGNAAKHPGYSCSLSENNTNVKPQTLLWKYWMIQGRTDPLWASVVPLYNKLINLLGPCVV